jgi:hypothetical protein
MVACPRGVSRSDRDIIHNRLCPPTVTPPEKFASKAEKL